MIAKLGKFSYTQDIIYSIITKLTFLHIFTHSSHAAGVDGGNRGERRRGRKEGVTGLVSHLHDNGYSHQLAWLEAYLNDEARDRRLDGKKHAHTHTHTHTHPPKCPFILQMNGKRCVLYL